MNHNPRRCEAAGHAETYGQTAFGGKRGTVQVSRPLRASRDPFSSLYVQPRHPNALFVVAAVVGQLVRTASASTTGASPSRRRPRGPREPPCDLQLDQRDPLSLALFCLSTHGSSQPPGGSAGPSESSRSCWFRRRASSLSLRGDACSSCWDPGGGAKQPSERTLRVTDNGVPPVRRRSDRRSTRSTCGSCRVYP